MTAPRLAVVGAGVMGVGIASLALGHGVPVLLVETDASRLAGAPARVHQHLRLARLTGALPAEEAPARLATSASLAGAADAAAVVEAVTENGACKAEVLSEAAMIVAPGTPLISNTSSIPIDELADSVSCPESLLGTHFMNPPYLIPTVEVIRGKRTGELALAAALRLLSALKRTPVVVGDTPGFVTSRILHPMINDAVRVVESGTATAEEVDALLQGCLGHRTGPLRTADLIGLDNLLDSLRVLHERTGDEGCRPTALLVDKVEAGHLGRKTGRGFYEYGETLL
ncbi:3-hydroxyacyl-CoA dehydrogenase family protein [Nocardiopsis ansamitocini]|uniref:3-hydroxybutyryl-CoA dehydrogenase n=1 Tax=Nocardiopsis ansamitocini TaxID=1670832 RepID=A0A9W6P6X5_9ACTN|nr:3-hydroxyacyl-CoA dehydrogenase family protein [Nocardiopsis ansamitocini]GLU48163.1 3-hydroxybutyryl-CoA dehydrogenase [Nocardiopsis ansamitocini]